MKSGTERRELVHQFSVQAIQQPQPFACELHRFRGGLLILKFADLPQMAIFLPHY